MLGDPGEYILRRCTGVLMVIVGCELKPINQTIHARLVQHLLRIPAMADRGRPAPDLSEASRLDSLPELRAGVEAIFIAFSEEKRQNPTAVRYDTFGLWNPRGRVRLQHIVRLAIQIDCFVITLSL